MAEYMRTSQGIIHWKDYGGSGDIIVLVHGLGGSVANWDAVGRSLATHGRVVALDLPGFGLSPPSADWELDTHAEAITAFVSELAGRVTLVGNSLGGLLCEMVAAEHPTMVGAMILVAPGTPPKLPDPLIHWPTARRLLLQAMPGLGTAISRYQVSRSSPEEIVQFSLDLVTHKPARVPMDLVDSFVELARVRKKLPWAADSVPKTGNSIARLFLRKSRFVSMIRRVKAQTLVVGGLEDQIVSPTSIEWVCSLRPDWELAQMEGIGHTPQIEAPVRFSRIVSPWLEARQSHEITA